MSTTAEQIRQCQAECDERKAILTSQVNAVLGNADFRKEVIELIVTLSTNHAKQFPNTKSFTCKFDDLVDEIAPDGGWDQAITAYSSLQKTVQDTYGRLLVYRVEFLHEFFESILDDLEMNRHGFRIQRHLDGDGCLPGTCGSFLNGVTLSWYRRD